MTPKQLADHAESRAVLQYPERRQIAAELRRLAAENEALRKDAERWRTFLATRPPSTHDVIREAIDAAMMSETVAKATGDKP